MLNKKICQECRKTVYIGGEDSGFPLSWNKDDESFWDKGLALCIQMQGAACIRTANLPPLRCPYRLEHILNNAK